MPKKKKKNRKSKAQKRLERMHSSVISGGNLPSKKNDFHKFTQEFMDHMSKHSDSKSEPEMQKNVETHVGICTLAWNLSLTGGTYEKSLEQLNLLSQEDSNLTERMGMKFMLVQALRILFSLPADEGSTVQSAVDIFTPEELDCFYKKINSISIEQDRSHPVLNRSFYEFSQEFFVLIRNSFLGASEYEMHDDLEKAAEICNLAWELSISGGTYESSLEEIKSLAMEEESEISVRMSVKSMLIQALRIIFELPSDEKNLIEAVSDVLSPEELEYFSQKIDFNGLEH